MEVRFKGKKNDLKNINEINNTCEENDIKNINNFLMDIEEYPTQRKLNKKDEKIK